VLFVFLGFLFAVFGQPVSLALGALVAVFGAGMMIYGSYQKAQTLNEPTIGELREEKKRRRAEAVARGGVDAEELYSELVTQYATRYGASSGIQLLQSEIQAYTRHGESFETAVERIYRRQKKRL
jgi:hypothetical protein